MSCGSVRWSEGASSAAARPARSGPRRRRPAPAAPRGVVVVLVLVGVVAGVRVVAELVAVAEVLDHPPGEAGEGLLVVEHVVEAGEACRRPVCSSTPRQRSMTFCGALGQAAAGGEVAHQVARGLGERRLGRVGDLGVAAAAGLLGDLGVDVAGGAGHGAGAHRLAARGLHRLEERRRPSRPPARSAGAWRRRGSAAAARRRRRCRAPAAPRRGSAAGSPAAGAWRRPRQPGGSTEKATVSSRSPAMARVASASAFLNGSAGLSAGLDIARVDHRRAPGRKGAARPQPPSGRSAAGLEGAARRLDPVGVGHRPGRQRPHRLEQAGAELGQGILHLRRVVGVTCG